MPASPKSSYILVSHSVTSGQISGYHTPSWRGYRGLSYEPKCLKISCQIRELKLGETYQWDVPCIIYDTLVVTYTLRIYVVVVQCARGFSSSMTGKPPNLTAHCISTTEMLHVTALFSVPYMLILYSRPILTRVTTRTAFTYCKSCYALCIMVCIISVQFSFSSSIFRYQCNHLVHRRAIEE